MGAKPVNLYYKMLIPSYLIGLLPDPLWPSSLCFELASETHADAHPPKGGCNGHVPPQTGAQVQAWLRALGSRGVDPATPTSEPESLGLVRWV